MDTTIRRVVLRHTGGPYPGLYQILGTIDSTGGVLPDVLPQAGALAPLWPDGRLASARKRTTQPRWVLYEEVAA